ncbi:hypothetical protein [Bradyrhizobium sp. CCBAU 11386]|uniref:hypothetical protein n=1 Tax=Bradyrhizobium sp. CCBAU 11386 TaxID=1630837 RepID=UPI0023033E6B|nr:hypothetical protein [Bradyrhizobium sp. CCBAU 11386]
MKPVNGTANSDMQAALTRAASEQFGKILLATDEVVFEAMDKSMRFREFWRPIRAGGDYRSRRYQLDVLAIGAISRL